MSKMRSTGSSLAISIWIALGGCAPRGGAVPNEQPSAMDAAARDSLASADSPVSVDSSVSALDSGSDATTAPDAIAEVTVAAADAGAEVAVTAACPASFASAGGLCTPAGKTCSYPQGTCACGAEGYCGGMAPNPMILANLKVPHWVCAPSPKVLGPDGCPLGMPTGACSTPGKQCSYRPCCSVTVTCKGGKWVQGGPMNCPP